MKVLKEMTVWIAIYAILWGVSYGVDQYSGVSDPVKVLYVWSGWLSFASLGLGLFARKWGRTLGLLAFAFAIMHLGIFVYFDFYFAWDLMLAELRQKHYLYYGILSFVLMAVLAGFSFGGKFYRPLVFLVLLSVIFALVHWVMIQKVLGVFYSALIVLVIGLVTYKAYVLMKKLFLKD